MPLPKNHSIFRDAPNSSELQRPYQDLETFFLVLNKEAQERSKRLFEKEAPELRKKSKPLSRN